MGSIQSAETLADGCTRMGDLQVHVGAQHAFPPSPPHQHRAQWSHGGDWNRRMLAQLIYETFTIHLQILHCLHVLPSHTLEDGPEGWTYNKPFVWYQFPYPAVYHGPALSTPAKLRLASPSSSGSRYLWSFSGTGRGLAGHLRSLLIKECTKCNRTDKTMDGPIP